MAQLLKDKIMTVTIRPLRATDRTEWDVLYQGYATFYKVEQTDDMRDS